MTKARETSDVLTLLESEYVKKNQVNNRNLIINGDFSVWQRGDSQVTSGYGSVDRFRMNTSGATFTVSKSTHTLGQTDVPGNPAYYLTDTVLAGDDNHYLEHRLENVALTAGREVTLSFYARGTNPGGGALSVTSIQNFGTGGSPSSSVAVIEDANIVLTANWTRYTVTFTPASVIGKTLGTDGNDFFGVFIGQPATDDTPSAWTLDISNVQLEFGDTATDFEYVNPADQLARCQRYYLDVLAGDYVADKPITPIAYWADTEARVPYIYPVTMRGIPSLEVSDVTHFKILVAGNSRATTNFVLSSASIVSPIAAEFKITTAADTAGHAGWLRTAAGAARLGLNAEL